jgi:RimJ/RimL family protein N-acetyltransferase
MFEIIGNKVILRDFIDSDIEKRILWETVETEWQLWDGPWVYENKTKSKALADIDAYIEKMKGLAEKSRSLNPDKKRTSFQICERESRNYIGWCNSYRIDNRFTHIADGGLCAIGIDIPESSAQGKGYGSEALVLFIDYLQSRGESDIYIQTWSGNARMIHIAKKLGFEECMRNIDMRFVRGKLYDGLTFRLNYEKFNEYKGKQNENTTIHPC